MCLISIVKNSLPLCVCLAAALVAGAQTNRDRNNPYTPSPAAVSQSETKKVAYTRPDITTVSIASTKIEIHPANTRTSPAVTSRGGDRSVSFAATDIYRVGAGDLIFIDLTNSVNGKGLYHVKANGTIDFPLAGENVVVAGKTTDAIQGMLESAITLYPNAKVNVKVREYASHRVTVSGLVSNGGDTFIRREAVPLFVISADAGVNPAAGKVVVRDGRTNAMKTYDIHDPNTGNVVINSGDEIEFTTP